MLTIQKTVYQCSYCYATRLSKKAMGKHESSCGRNPANMDENGISHEGELLDVGIELGILTKSGAFIKWNEKIIGQGRPASILYLKENKKEAEQKLISKGKAGVQALKDLALLVVNRGK